jgi:hypothetical protein
MSVSVVAPGRASASGKTSDLKFTFGHRIAIGIILAPNAQRIPSALSTAPSFIDIDNFLSEGANGPEHQALRRLAETSAPTATMLIAYDVHLPMGDAYEKLAEAIQSLGAWWHHLETVWIVRCAQTPAQIFRLPGDHESRLSSERSVALSGGRSRSSLCFCGYFFPVLPPFGA